MAKRKRAKGYGGQVGLTISKHIYDRLWDAKNKFINMTWDEFFDYLLSLIL